MCLYETALNYRPVKTITVEAVAEGRDACFSPDE